MTKKPIIIDMDPGIDDAVALAIALFSEMLDVRMITTVHGKVSLERVTYKAFRLMKYYDIQVHIAKGAYIFVVTDVLDACDIHGETGIEGYEFEEPNNDLLLDKHAVNAMYEEILNSKEKITIVPIGPLTNIALLLRLYPEVKENIEELILMGGSTGRGNASVMAE